MSKINWKMKLTRTHAVVGGVAFIGLMVLIQALIQALSVGPSSQPLESVPVAEVKQRSEPDQPAVEPVVEEASKAVVAIWPEHEGLPIYREPADSVIVGEPGYMVMLEPIGGLGQLKAELVYSAEESDSFVSNCVDVRRKLSKADMQIGEYDGMEMYFDDYADWILQAAIMFCDADFPTDKAPVSQAEPEPLEPSLSPSLGSSTQAVVNAGDGVANLRAIASTESEIVGKAQNGSVIQVLEETTNSAGQRWLRTPEGWIWDGLTQNEPLDYDPQREAPTTAQAQDCDRAYPGICIPSTGRNLNCSDIGYENFSVPGADPHGFDRDQDGLGCEAGA
jgi:hypothetical protein